jgi:hypothetical protein
VWEFLEMVGIIVLMFLPFVGLFALMGRLGAEEKRPERRTVFAWLPTRIYKGIGPGAIVGPVSWAWLRNVSRQRTVIGLVFHFELPDEHETSGHQA